MMIGGVVGNRLSMGFAGILLLDLIVSSLLTWIHPFYCQKILSLRVTKSITASATKFHVLLWEASQAFLDHNTSEACKSLMDNRWLFDIFPSRFCLVRTL